MLLRNKVVIFDTAAGRVVGEVTDYDTLSVALKKPAVMSINQADDGNVEIGVGAIAYAPEQYFLAWGGVRGYVSADGAYLRSYTDYVERGHVDAKPQG